MAKDLEALEIINNYSPTQFEKVVQENNCGFLITIFQIAYDFHKIYIFVSQEEIDNFNPYLEIMEQISNTIIFDNLKLEQKIIICNIIDEREVSKIFQKLD